MAATSTLTRVLKALADVTRLRIVHVLGVEELSVGELGESLGLPQSSVSRHLAVLRDAGVVSDRRIGTRVYCRLADSFRSDHAALVDRIDDDAVPEATSDLARLDQVLAARTPSDEALDEIAEDWDTLRDAQVAPTVTATAVTALVPPELTIVDVGCGTGVLLPHVCGVASHVHAVDRSEAALRQARSRAAQGGLRNVTFHRAPAEALPLEDGSCDAVLLSLLLRFTARPALAVAEAARVTRPGGRVVLVDFVPHEDERLRSELGHQWLGFTRDEVAGWCADAGLELASYDVIASPGSPKSDSVPATFVAYADRILSSVPSTPVPKALRSST